MKNNFFKWESIAINTYVAKTPTGWVLRSVDVKNDIIEETEEIDKKNEDGEENKGNVYNEKIPLSMSNSMIVLDDPQHICTFENFRWFFIAPNTWRANVIGGWVIKCVDYRNINYIIDLEKYEELGSMDFEQLIVSSSMVFVPDPEHKWYISRPQYNSPPKDK